MGHREKTKKQGYKKYTREETSPEKDKKEIDLYIFRLDSEHEMDKQTNYFWCYLYS